MLLERYLVPASLREWAVLGACATVGNSWLGDRDLVPLFLQITGPVHPLIRRKRGFCSMEGRAWLLGSCKDLHHLGLGHELSFDINTSFIHPAYHDPTCIIPDHLLFH